jgi:hypothetical protein
MFGSIECRPASPRSATIRRFVMVDDPPTIPQPSQGPAGRCWTVARPSENTGHEDVATSKASVR